MRNRLLQGYIIGLTPFRAKVRIQPEQESGKSLIASPTGSTTWSVQKCLDRKPEEVEVNHEITTMKKPPMGPEDKAIDWFSSAASDRELVENTLILAWFMGENILVWEDGLDCLWNIQLRGWQDQNFQCNRYGPSTDGRNRGPVWVLLRFQRRV